MAPQAQAMRQARWQAMAQGRGWAAWLLWPLSVLMGGALAMRRRLYRWGVFPSHRLPVPVLVVGNVIVGGAGKTPTTIAVVQHLQAAGWHPGVVSRGHGRREVSARCVQAQSDPADVGDEPLLIKQGTGVPVWVAPHRALAGRHLLRASPEVDVVVCDDGLQHLALKSDVRVAVFDDRGIGNGWLLPAGLLREPWPPSNGEHAPQIVLHQHRAEPASALACPAPIERYEARRALARHAVNLKGQHRALHSFAAVPLLAAAGIARPQVFFAMLREQGLSPSAELALPDHADAASWQEALAGHSGVVLCTQKDLVKLQGLDDRLQLWAVPLVLDIDPGFFAAIERHLGPAPN